MLGRTATLSKSIVGDTMPNACERMRRREQKGLNGKARKREEECEGGVALGEAVQTGCAERDVRSNEIPRKINASMGKLLLTGVKN